MIVVSMTDDLLMGIPVMYPSHVKQLLYADIRGGGKQPKNYRYYPK